jgi:hypothetical protein
MMGIPRVDMFLAGAAAFMNSDIFGRSLKCIRTPPGQVPTLLDDQEQVYTDDIARSTSRAL